MGKYIYIYQSHGWYGGIPPPPVVMLWMSYTTHHRGPKPTGLAMARCHFVQRPATTWKQRWNNLEIYDLYITDHHGDMASTVQWWSYGYIIWCWWFRNPAMYFKPCQYWDKLPTSTGSGIFYHQPYYDILMKYRQFCKIDTQSQTGTISGSRPVPQICCESNIFGNFWCQPITSTTFDNFLITSDTYTYINPSCTIFPKLGFPPNHPYLIRLSNKKTSILGVCTAILWKHPYICNLDLWICQWHSRDLCLRDQWMWGYAYHCIPLISIGDGHEPSSRGLYSHYKDSLLKVGWPSPIQGV